MLQICNLFICSDEHCWRLTLLANSRLMLCNPEYSSRNPNPTKDLNPESKFIWQWLRNQEPAAWDPESKIVLDSIIGGDNSEN